MTKQPKRPIDAQDMPWSYIGKDALDAAAERLWDVLQTGDILDTGPDCPYHLALSHKQAVVQNAVLSVLGTTVPTLLRQRAKDLGSDLVGKTALRDLAEELENDHG